MAGVDDQSRPRRIANAACSRLRVVGDPPRRLATVLLHLENEDAIGPLGHGIRAEAAGSVERHARPQVEAPLVQGADESGPTHQTIGERAALVRAVGLRGEGMALATVEDRDALIRLRETYALLP